VLQVSQEESINYLYGEKDITLIIDQATNTITGNSNNLRKTIGDDSFNILTIMDISSNHLDSDFSFNSTKDSIATIDASGIVTIFNTGTTTLSISQSETNNYFSSNVYNVNLTVVSPTIITSSDSINVTYGVLPFNLISVSDVSSNNMESNYTFDLSDNTIATVDASGIVTILQAGTTTLSINQEASSNYASGSKSITLTVNQQTTIITANDIVTRTFLDEPFSLITGADISSNNIDSVYTFDSSDNEFAMVDASGIVTILKSGRPTSWRIIFNR
jgi:hypothetical protein